MRVERLTEPRQFPPAVESFLLGREAENNLMLGLVADIVLGRREGQGEPTLYVMREGPGELVGAALWAGYSLILTRGSPASHGALADYLVENGIFPPAVSGPASAAAAFAVAWLGRTSQPHAPGPVMRLMQADAFIPQPRPARGSLRLATPDELPVAWAWAQAFAAETNVRAGVRRDRIQWLVEHRRAWFWCDPEPVAMAAAVGTTARGARVGGVYTPPELRGRGYASACVAGVTRELLGEGRKAVFLYAESQNQTANRIYESIGYEFVCEWQEIDLKPANDEGAGSTRSHLGGGHHPHATSTPNK